MLIDDHDGQRARAIARVERSSSENWETNGVEVLGRDHVVEARRRAFRQRRHALGANRLLVTAESSDELHAIGSRARDAGNRAQTAEQLVGSGAHRGLIAVLRIDELDASGEQVAFVVACLGLAHTNKALGELACAGQQNQRKRELARDE